MSKALARLEMDCTFTYRLALDPNVGPPHVHKINAEQIRGLPRIPKPTTSPQNPCQPLTRCAGRCLVFRKTPTIGERTILILGLLWLGNGALFPSIVFFLRRTDTQSLRSIVRWSGPIYPTVTTNQGTRTGFLPPLKVIATSFPCR